VGFYRCFLFDFAAIAAKPNKKHPKTFAIYGLSKCPGENPYSSRMRRLRPGCILLEEAAKGRIDDG
jgi:hypothetical protein